ncbi:hypothetical protein [Paractinoplanes atraurantiacus]|uniref:Uncharacterized protein n=1 Tax=Paractinoplanes atraurantiacus TaxID=1036182 RepID=A0A285JY45_9ACTN|nr:hypothetical protein [Actinoplanes atraurantiacus]SNY65254.1 hypothetical protein SAMN05421748_12812 [Actinoplanes atraurantiacus]
MAEWCRSCGGESTGDEVCGDCGVPLDPPAPGGERTVRGVLRRRSAPRLGGAPLGARRAAAIDLIAQGRPLPAELDLTDHEIAWYRAHAAVNGGDLTAALDQMAKLPETGYAARVGLLLSVFPALLATRDCWPAAVAVLAPFVSGSDDAAAMVAVLGRTTPDVVDVARRYAGRSFGEGRRARALTAYERAVTGEADSVPGDLVPLLAPALLDRLAVAGVLSDLPDGLPEPAATSLRCRLGLATAEQTAEAGFAAEAARRAYLTGEAPGDRLGDGPDVRHYRALHDYVTTRRLREEDLRPGAREVIRLTDAVTIGFAGRRSVPDEVAADPTTWPRLWPNAAQGKLYPADGVAQRHPRFVLWLELCTAYPALRGGLWPEALRIAGRVGEAAQDPALRAEARNVAAYAYWQLGRVDDALRELGEAKGAGFAVNAMLVASSRNAAAALPHLAQIMRLAEDDQLREAAVRRVIEHDEPSATLVAIIRAALDLTVDDDLHQQLLALSFRHDRAWLATAPLPARRRDDRYFQALAAYEEEPSTAGLGEIAAALADLWRRPGRPAWVETETRRLTAGLAGLPETVDALRAVETLAQAGMLSLADRIRYRAFAGARQIATAEWSPRLGRPLPGEAALARAVDEYWQRSGELEADVLATVEESLAEDVRWAALTIGNTAIRFWNAFDKRMATLAQSAGRTWEENQPNEAARRQLVKDLEAHVDRSERLLRLTDGLTVDPQFRKDMRAFHDKARTTIPYLRRRTV